MITSRGGMGKGRPDVQHGGSAGSFWPSAVKAGKNTGFSAKGTRRGCQLSLASPPTPPPRSPLLKHGPLLACSTGPGQGWSPGQQQLGRGGVYDGSPASVQPGSVSQGWAGDYWQPSVISKISGSFSVPVLGTHRHSSSTRQAPDTPLSRA